MAASEKIILSRKGVRGCLRACSHKMNVRIFERNFADNKKENEGELSS